VDAYLANQTSASDRKSYGDLLAWGQADSWIYIHGLGAAVKGGKERYPGKMYYEERVDIINAAEVVFAFFLPSDYQGPTAEKFWGAIRFLIEVSMPSYFAPRGC